MSRMFHLLNFLAIVFTMQTDARPFTAPEASTNAPSLRLLCENHPIDSQALTTLRSDVQTDFIPATIYIKNMDGSALTDFKQIQLMASDGINAEAYAIAKSAKSVLGLYHLEMSYALRSGEAHLVTEDLSDLNWPYLYTVVTDGLWVHNRQGALHFYGFHGQKINRVLKTTGMLAARKGLIVKTTENNLQQLKIWDDQNSSWRTLASALNKGQSIELASSQSSDWTLLSELKAGEGFLWKLQFRGQPAPLLMKGHSKPFVFNRNNSVFVAWSDEGLDAKRMFTGQTQIAQLGSDLKTISQNQIPYSTQIKNQVEKSIRNSGSVFVPVGYDAAQDSLVFSSGNLGGAASLNLKTQNLILQGAYGSSWACHNPSLIEEVTAW